MKSRLHAALFVWIRVHSWLNQRFPKPERCRRKFRERSRPGCCPARPRAGHERAGRTEWSVPVARWSGPRGRGPAAPEAGAIPGPIASLLSHRLRLVELVSKFRSERSRRREEAEPLEITGLSASSPRRLRMLKPLLHNCGKKFRISVTFPSLRRNPR